MDEDFTHMKVWKPKELTWTPEPPEGEYDFDASCDYLVWVIGGKPYAKTFHEGVYYYCPLPEVAR